MTQRIGIVVGVLMASIIGSAAWAAPWGTSLPEEVGQPIALPDPVTAGGEAMRDVMASRRSVRHFTDEKVTLQELSQLLWAAQGVTNTKGWRTVPSAGAKFPIEIYVVADRVEGLEPGLYHYRVGAHELALIRSPAEKIDLQRACLNQASVSRAALDLIIMGVVWRVAEKYGEERSERYVVVEGGAVMEHVSLEAHALGLGSVCVCGLEDDQVQQFVGTDTLPIAVMPVGRPEPSE